MLDTLKCILSTPGCFGDLTPEHDTRFNADIKLHLETSATQGSIGKHFLNAFGYVMHSMEKMNE